MSKLIGLLNSPWVGVALAVVAFLLGVGDVPFTDLASFTAWLNAHFPQVGGLTIVASAVWFVLQKLKEFINRDAIAKALADGKLDLSDIIGAVDDTGGREVGTYVKSALADGAIVTLRHACNHSKELTGKLNEFAGSYYLDQCSESACESA